MARAPKACITYSPFLLLRHELLKFRYYLCGPVSWKKEKTIRRRRSRSRTQMFLISNCAVFWSARSHQWLYGWAQPAGVARLGGHTWSQYRFFFEALALPRSIPSDFEYAEHKQDYLISQPLCAVHRGWMCPFFVCGCSLDSCFYCQTGELLLFKSDDE